MVCVIFVMVTISSCGHIVVSTAYSPYMSGTSTSNVKSYRVPLTNL